jgi:uncharacterized protein
MSKQHDGAARQTSDFSLKLRSFNEDEGTFEGYASVFNNVDWAGDVILPGAFTRTLKNKMTNGKSFPLLWQHDPYEPIGMITEAYEDANGLKFKGKIIMESDSARQKHALLKAGAISGVSIGYDPVEYSMVDDTMEEDSKGCRRKLKEIRLWEISLVTFPCNEEAQVTDVKSVAELSNTVNTLTASLEALMAKMTELVDTNNNLLKSQLPPDAQTADGDTTPVVEEASPDTLDDANPAAPVIDDAAPEVIEEVIDEVDLSGCFFAESLAIQNALDMTTSLSAEIAGLRKEGSETL